MRIRQHPSGVIKCLKARIILANIFLETATDHLQLAAVRRQRKHREFDAGRAGV
jgi:hypothetical protein